MADDIVPDVPGKPYYFDTYVAERYDGEYLPEPAIVSDDIPFYVELAATVAGSGQAILELGCGTGRVAIPMAQVCTNVIGIDNSAAMLSVAMRKTKSLRLKNVSWLQAEMSNFHLRQRFDLIVIPARSFEFLLTTEEQLGCLRCIGQHLTETGKLVFNLHNAATLYAQDCLESTGGLWERRDERTEREMWIRRHVSTAKQLLHEHRIDFERNRDGQVVNRVERDLYIRYIFRYEMEHLLCLSGLRAEALYGYFDRRPYADDSSEMIWIATRAPISPRLRQATGPGV